MHGILRELQALVELVPALRKLVAVAPRLSFRRSRNLKDILVRTKLQPLEKGSEECFGVERPDARFVNLLKGDLFCGNAEKRSFHITYSFDCNPQGISYLITCKRCGKHVGNTTTPFRLRSNNHKISLKRYEKGERGICAEHLYAYIFEDEHIGLGDLSVQIIDVTDVRDPTVKEGFWIQKLKCYAPLGLNLMAV